MRYSVHANVITLHNDDDFDSSEESYEFECDIDESSEEDCEDCKERWKKEKDNQLFLKVVRDVLEIPSTNHSFEITCIDWKMVKRVCDIKFENRSLKVTNYKSGKSVTCELYSLYCYCFTYSIGSFWNSCNNKVETSTFINWMDSFVAGAFGNDYQLFVSYILSYVKDCFLSDGGKISFLEKEFKVGFLTCNTNSISMVGCHFMHTFRKIDEVTFRELYTKVTKLYVEIMEQRISTMSNSLEIDKQMLKKKTKKMLADSTKNQTELENLIAQKRAAIENIQNNFKKFKS